MGLETATVLSSSNILTSNYKVANLSSSNSMSQDYHQNGAVFSFSNGFQTSSSPASHQEDQIHKLRVSGYDPPQSSGDPLPPAVYDSAGAGMLSEMFNFAPSTATELLENQILQGYRNSSNWLPPDSSKNQISGMNADSAASMQLYPSTTSSSPPSSRPPSTLHMLLPNPSSSSTTHQFDEFPSWNNEILSAGGGQGLSLSLSSSLQQHLDVAAKAEELRIGDAAGMLIFGQLGPAAAAAQFQFKNFTNQLAPTPGIGSSYGTSVSLIRNSKYAKAAQELLEEFCCVGRGGHQLRKNKSSSGNPNSNSGAGNADGDSPAALSAGDRIEQQRRKVKLLSMLDEVDRRYNHYCDQMQTVVNSFDMVMGLGAAVPYTSLAQKAMSRHFRCLKDAITTQLKQSCELLGEKDAGGTSGVTKGETPRLRIIDQSIRQQRAFSQMGMMEQEAWRPQRGLPERSVNVLRAWLFEHFLHPYPSDGDKHLLARQTGLSRNQVSNWFINARVRLWKPMVEEMYQQEANDDSDDTTQTPATTATIMPPPPPSGNTGPENSSALSVPATVEHESDVAAMELTAAVLTFGATSGDVSLTLGLRHAGNLPPEKGSFPVRDFGSF